MDFAGGASPQDSVEERTLAVLRSLSLNFCVNLIDFCGNFHDAGPGIPILDLPAANLSLHVPSLSGLLGHGDFRESDVERAGDIGG